MKTRQIVKSLRCVVCILVCVVRCPAQADDEVDILKYLYDKSDLVVMGRIMTEGGGAIMGGGVKVFDVSTGYNVQVEDVLKGNDKLRDQIINVIVRRIVVIEEEIKNPLFKKDAKHIFFLKENKMTPALRNMLKDWSEELQARYPEEKLDFRVNLDASSWETVNPWFGIHHPDPAMARTLKGLSKKP